MQQKNRFLIIFDFLSILEVFVDDCVKLLRQLLTEKTLPSADLTLYKKLGTLFV